MTTPPDSDLPLVPVQTVRDDVSNPAYHQVGDHYEVVAESLPPAITIAFAPPSMAEREDID